MPAGPGAVELADDVSSPGAGAQRGGQLQQRGDGLVQGAEAGGIAGGRPGVPVDARAGWDCRRGVVTRGGVAARLTRVLEAGRPGARLARVASRCRARRRRPRSGRRGRGSSRRGRRRAGRRRRTVPRKVQPCCDAHSRQPGRTCRDSPNRRDLPDTSRLCSCFFDCEIPWIAVNVIAAGPWRVRVGGLANVISRVITPLSSSIAVHRLVEATCLSALSSLREPYGQTMPNLGDAATVQPLPVLRPRCDRRFSRLPAAHRERHRTPERPHCPRQLSTRLGCIRP